MNSWPIAINSFSLNCGCFDGFPQHLTPENLYNKMWQCIFRNGAEFMWTSKSKSMVVFAWDLGLSNSLSEKLIYICSSHWFICHHYKNRICCKSVAINQNMWRVRRFFPQLWRFDVTLLVLNHIQNSSARVMINGVNVIIMVTIRRAHEKLQ